VNLVVGCQRLFAGRCDVRIETTPALYPRSGEVSWIEWGWQAISIVNNQLQWSGKADAK